MIDVTSNYNNNRCQNLTWTLSADRGSFLFYCQTIKINWPLKKKKKKNHLCANALHNAKHKAINPPHRLQR